MTKVKKINEFFFGKKTHHPINKQYIKDALIHLYDVTDISDEILDEFELSPFYKTDFSEKEYIKAFMKFYLKFNPEAREFSESEEQISYADIVKEDGGVACANAGNVSGMGAVVSAQPSAIPGQTMGGSVAGDSFGNGGVVGSGDVAAGSNRNIRKRDSELPRSRRKNKAKAALKSKKNPHFSVKSNNEVEFNKKRSNTIKKFNEFVKESINERFDYSSKPYIIDGERIDDVLVADADENFADNPLFYVWSEYPKYKQMKDGYLAYTYEFYKDDKGNRYLIVSDLSKVEPSEIHELLAKANWNSARNVDTFVNNADKEDYAKWLDDIS